MFGVLRRVSNKGPHIQTKSCMRSGLPVAHSLRATVPRRNYSAPGSTPQIHNNAELEDVAKIYPDLGSICNIELLQDAEPEAIKEIWEKYHATKYCISGVIPKDIYMKLRKRWTKYPTFLIPLPKDEGGTEFFVMQYHPYDLVTYVRLAEYHLYQSQDDPVNTPKALQTMHYVELIREKELVLMRGEIDPLQVTAQECQLLVNQMQLYYLNDERLELVKQFNENPKEFDFNKLLELQLPSF